MRERREGVQRAPRSGGRTTERGTGDIRRTPVTSGTRATGAQTVGAQTAGVRAGEARAGRVGEPRSVEAAGGPRRYPTQGSAALKLDVAQPVRADEVAAEPRLQVAPPAPVSAPRAPFVAVVIALVVAGVFGILLINTKTNENTFEIYQLQKEKALLDSQQQDLEAKLTDYNNPGSLRAMAKKLGLVESDSFAYIRLPDGKVIGVLKPATSQPAITSQDPDAPATGTAPATGR